jgi:NRAMP (natural resistance-associated macrophage protein)-like metal ion transporter
MADEEPRAPARPADTEAPAPAPPVLDEAHIGDIRGALGTIRLDDVGPRTSWRGRLVTLLAIMGPGLIVMVGDNDAGGVATYAQAGQDYGTSLLWVLLLLIPVLIVNQEMVVRLGAVTGVGHGRLILERFGRFWGAFSIIDLFVLNFLTIVTEFIGISLALGYLGISRFISVPLAGIALVAMTSTGSFQNWERFMFVFVAGNMLVIPLAVYAHPNAGTMAHDFVVPGVAGGVNSTSVLLIIAMVGTTVAPWQLFFQQSNVIDKRITTRWINYERADTVIGSVVVVIGATLLIAATAFPFANTPLYGHFTNAEGVARGLEHTLGHPTGVLFALVLLNASIIGAGAVTLSTSYAFGDVFGLRHSLHRPPSEAKFFYGSFVTLVALACAIVLIPGAPLGLITVAVQALAGVLLPSASVFLLLLCNDRHVLGPWRNKTWLNALATVILGVLLMLSAILVVTTVFPHVNVTLLLIALSGALAAGCLVLAATALRTRARAIPEDAPGALAKRTYAAALAAARADRDQALAAATAIRARAEATARSDYAAALDTAGPDAVARAAAKAEHDRARAEARADYIHARALANNAYARARAVAKADYDKALAAAKAEARTWTMPPLALLAKPEWSRGRILAMYTMRGYLVVAVILLAVKAGKLAGGL